MPKRTRSDHDVAMSKAYSISSGSGYSIVYRCDV